MMSREGSLKRRLHELKESNEKIREQAELNHKEWVEVYEKLKNELHQKEKECNQLKFRIEKFEERLRKVSEILNDQEQELLKYTGT